MGADLYIKDMNRESQYRGFEVSKEAVEVGYFRDCYNDGGLFSNLGLSWWELAGKFKLDDNEREMTLAQIPEFRAILTEAISNFKPPTGDKLMSCFDKDDLPKTEAEATIRYREYFIDCWANLLLRLLEIAEEKKSNIMWSV